MVCVMCCDEWANWPTLLPLPLPLPLPCQIYNGDFDASVPWIADEAWTDGLGYDTEEEWRPWLVQGVTAGGWVGE